MPVISKTYYIMICKPLVAESVEADALSAPECLTIFKFLRGLSHLGSNDVLDRDTRSMTQLELQSPSPSACDLKLNAHFLFLVCRSMFGS